ncbi:MAG: diphosphomevalonate decarboxylase [Bacillota bacterium]|jgi:diphosphomevalonate decarboxylase
MKKVIARSPVNIALIKYWGKANEQLVLPTTTSVSLTLTDLWTETTFEEGHFSFELNNKPADLQETKRVKDVLKHFRDDQVVIKSKNNFPTASGLASSASGFAALTVGLNKFYDANYTLQELATLTRVGSGSSCRSLVDGFAIWHRNGTLESITNPFQNLMMIVVLISEDKKAISSREAMKITKETAPTYASWTQASEEDFQNIRIAINEKQLDRVGQIMEMNSQRLHQVMKDSIPSIIYQQTSSIEVLNLVKKARTKGLIGYTTMDAGPNVKILIQQHQLEDWKQLLKANISYRFLVSRIGGKADAE